MIVVVGAHSRKVGKTSITCELIRATPEISWTAAKISANRRGLAVGLSIEEEYEARPDRDTGRFLEAGAKRAIWIRAADAEMAAAATSVGEFAKQGHLIVESNRIIEHVDADLFVLALDSRVEDFKDSARRVFERADAYISCCAEATSADWPGLPLGETASRPLYRIAPPDYAPAELLVDLRRRLGIIDREEAA